jgi:hypothetical protein
MFDQHLLLQGALPRTAAGDELLNNEVYLLAHANHHTSVAGTANNAGEHRAWGIISGESGLQQRSRMFKNC